MNAKVKWSVPKDLIDAICDEADAMDIDFDSSSLMEVDSKNAAIRFARLVYDYILREREQNAGEAVSVPDEWRQLMTELADDLESEIEARRRGDLPRRIERDLEIVRRARAMLASAPTAQAVSVLDAPARVGNTTFGKGVKWSTVIGCAQRAYGSKPLTPDQTKAFAEVIDEVRSSAAPAGDGGSHE